MTGMLKRRKRWVLGGFCAAAVTLTPFSTALAGTGTGAGTGPDYSNGSTITVDVPWAQYHSGDTYKVSVDRGNSDSNAVQTFTLTDSNQTYSYHNTEYEQFTFVLQGIHHRGEYFIEVTDCTANGESVTDTGFSMGSTFYPTNKFHYEGNGTTGQLPEVPYSAALPIAMVGLGGGYWFLRRRRAARER